MEGNVSMFLQRDGYMSEVSQSTYYRMTWKIVLLLHVFEFKSNMLFSPLRVT